MIIKTVIDRPFDFSLLTRELTEAGVIIHLFEVKGDRLNPYWGVLSHDDSQLDLVNVVIAAHGSNKIEDPTDSEIQSLESGKASIEEIQLSLAKALRLIRGK